jgi:hypothetical protein
MQQEATMWQAQVWPALLCGRLTFKDVTFSGKIQLSGFFNN